LHIQAALNLYGVLAKLLRSAKDTISVTGRPRSPSRSENTLLRGRREIPERDPSALTKPFRDQDLLDAVQLSLSRDRARRDNEKELAILKERFGLLSPREREIVIQVAQGRQSKQIAYDIGIAEATVKVHRCRAMQKMQAGSLPELGRLADKLKLVPDGPHRS
jgi:DNA-binding NarL/FixJ family response regulator